MRQGIKVGISPNPLSLGVEQGSNPLVTTRPLTSSAPSQSESNSSLTYAGTYPSQLPLPGDCPKGEGTYGPTFLLVVCAISTLGGRRRLEVVVDVKDAAPKGADAPHANAPVGIRQGPGRQARRHCVCVCVCMCVCVCVCA